MYPSQIRSVASLASLYSVRMMGLFMVLPVLTLAADEYNGSSVFLLGVALGAYGLTQAILQIPFGLLSDRYGRKRLIVIGLLLFVLGSVMAAMAESVMGLILGRILQGAGAVAGVIMAMVGDLVREEHRTKAMATIGASIGIAFALSLVIGPLVVAGGGIRWVFWLTAVLSILGLMILVFVVPTPPKQAKRPSMIRADLKLVLVNPQLLRLNIGIFILHAVLMALFVALPLMLDSYSIPQVHHSWIYLGVMFGAFCFMLPLIIVGERKNRLKVLFLSMILLMGVSLVVMNFLVTGPVLMISLMLIFFIGFNYLEATLPSLMSRVVPAPQRGAGSGLFSTFQFMGAACGGVVGGYLYELYGTDVMFLVAAVSMLVWWLIALGMSVPAQQAKMPSENVVA